MPEIEDYVADPYKALGLRPVINATCHHTRVGGTLIPPQVLDAMRAAAQTHVDMNELQRAAGRVIARYTHAESGYVVSGCAAALMVGAAAILTGKDPTKMQQLPDLTGMKREAIGERFPRRRTPDGREYIHYGYAHAVTTTGLRFVEVGDGKVTTAEQLEAAFTDQTALVYWGTGEVEGNLQVEDVVRIASRHDVPVLVDNSNHLPPKSNLWRYIDAGADLVAFSGGKGLRGPQGAGILAGRRDLIEAVSMQSAPTQGIGRVAKVSKEEIVGLLAALELWAQTDDETRLTEERARAQLLLDRIGKTRGADAYLMFPDQNGRPYSTVIVKALPESELDAAEILKQLEAGEPSIAAMTGWAPDIVRLDVRLCEPEEIEVIGKRLREIFGG